MSAVARIDLARRSPSAAPMTAIPVIAHGTARTREERWRRRIDLEQDALFTISAFARVSHSNRGSASIHAGVQLIVKLDGRPVAADQSFEGRTTNLAFLATASYSTFLEQGSYELEVVRENLGAADQQPLLKASYHAVAASDQTH